MPLTPGNDPQRPRASKLVRIIVLMVILGWLAVMFFPHGGIRGNLMQEHAARPSSEGNTSSARVDPGRIAELKRSIEAASTPEELRMLSRTWLKQGRLRELSLTSFVNDRFLPTPLESAAQEWQKHGSSYLLQMISALPDDSVSGVRERALHACRSHYAEEPDFYLTAARDLLPASAANVVVAQVMDEIAQRSPQRGVELLNAMGDGLIRRTAVSEFFGKLAGSDSAGALELIPQLAGDDFQDVAYTSWASRLSSQASVPLPEGEAGQAVVKALLQALERQDRQDLLNHYRSLFKQP